jgi:hypothetical protein
MGGGFIPGLHEKGFESIQKFFEDAAKSKHFEKNDLYEKKWALTDKTTGETYQQMFVIDESDLNAYLTWKNHKVSPKAPNVLDGLQDYLGDFMVFWGRVTQIGLNMRSDDSKLIRTNALRPHNYFKNWIRDGFHIVHYDKNLVWDDETKKFGVNQQSIFQYNKDMEDLEGLEVELGHKIPYHEFAIPLTEISEPERVI